MYVHSFCFLGGIERRLTPRVVSQGTTMHVPREPRHHIRAYHIKYSFRESEMVKWSVDVLEICVVRDSFYVAGGANTGPIFRNTRRLIHSFGFVPVLARCSDKN